MKRYTWYETKMTSNTTPAPLVASASSNYNGTTPSQTFHAFDGNNNTNWGTVVNTLTGWIKLDFGVVTEVDVFKIMASDNTAPKNFVMYGSNDDSVYVELLNVSNQTGWTIPNQERIFELGYRVKYRYYRLNVTANNGNTISTWVNDLSFGTTFKDKILLLSNEKTYSLESIDNRYETKMTSNTAPSPLVISSSSFYSSYSAFKAFNGTNSNKDDCYMTSNNNSGEWIQIYFGSERLVNHVYITSRNLNEPSSAIKDFNILSSNDGINFNLIAEIRNQTDWTSAETRGFSTQASKCNYLRLEILSNNGEIRTTIGQILYAYKHMLTELTSSSIDNFINYGTPSINNFDLIQSSKNYILQDTISANEEGLWTTQLNRKPLSISFN